MFVGVSVQPSQTTPRLVLGCQGSRLRACSLALGGRPESCRLTCPRTRQLARLESVAGVVVKLRGTSNNNGTGKGVRPS